MRWLEWLVLCECVNKVLAESQRWRRPLRAADSEYTTYSETQIKVYKDDQLITSTNNGVRRSSSN